MYVLNPKQERNAFESFKKVVNKRDPEFISEDLYNHLNLNCNFASYFSLDGFKDAYSDKKGFHEFLEHFDRNSPRIEWLNAPEISTQFSALNQSLVDFVSSQSPEIYKDL